MAAVEVLALQRVQAAGVTTHLDNLHVGRMARAEMVAHVVSIQEEMETMYARIFPLDGD